LKHISREDAAHAHAQARPTGLWIALLTLSDASGEEIADPTEIEPSGRIRRQERAWLLAAAAATVTEHGRTPLINLARCQSWLQTSPVESHDDRRRQLIVHPTPIFRAELVHGRQPKLRLKLRCWSGGRSRLWLLPGDALFRYAVTPRCGASGGLGGPSHAVEIVTAALVQARKGFQTSEHLPSSGSHHAGLGSGLRGLWGTALGCPERSASGNGLGRGMAEGWGGSAAAAPGHGMDGLAMAAGEVHGVDGMRTVCHFATFQCGGAGACHLAYLVVQSHFRPNGNLGKTGARPMVGCCRNRFKGPMMSWLTPDVGMPSEVVSEDPLLMSITVLTLLGLELANELQV
jgi:hypothetical protein